MPEQPRHEGGDAHIGRIPRCHRADIARERKLRDIEFLVAEGAKEDLFRIKREIGDLAAFHLDAAVPDGARAVVVAARNGYGHLHHWGLLFGFALGWDGRKAAKRKLKSSAKRTCFSFGCEASPCCTLSCAIFSGCDAARCERARPRGIGRGDKAMMSTVIGGAMLPHAPQFFTMPETEDKKVVEHVRDVAADIGRKLRALQP